MRLDVFLHKVCLMKSRSMAGEACQRGKVELDGGPARASREVRPGSRIRFDLGRGALEVEVVAIPERNVSKSHARDFYRILADTRGAEPADLLGD